MKLKLHTEERQGQCQWKSPCNIHFEQKTTTRDRKKINGFDFPGKEKSNFI